MVVCYASKLGSCSSKQSREHYLSKGLWKSDTITFEGLPWLKGESRKLPVESVARRNLCTTHNSALTTLDAAAKKLFRTIDELHAIQHQRSMLSRSKLWTPERCQLSGFQIERFFAKLATGILQEDREERSWHLDGSPAIDPPLEVLQCIYGEAGFEHPNGLYGLHVVGDQVPILEDRVTVETLFHPTSRGYIGAIVNFRHWPFLINLSGVDLSTYQFLATSGRLFGAGGETPIYRPSEFNFAAKGKLAAKLTIVW